MLNFLREHELPKAFRAQKKNATKVIIASPFWGSGAIEMLGLRNGPKKLILCNLTSTACNPYVIEELVGLEAVTVRSHPRLHAKVYATPSAVIIGSSNASTKGLTVAGEMPSAWVEANVLSDDLDLVREVLRFFNQTWNSSETQDVTADSKILREAKTSWDNRPKPPVGRTRSLHSLFSACRESPELFRSVFVASYDEGLGPKAAQKLTELKKSARPKSGISSADFKKAWGYQIDPVAQGSWLIDLDCRGTKSKVWGCSQATGLVLPLEDEYDLTITLRGRITLKEFSQPFNLSKAQKNALIENAPLIHKQVDLVPLIKAIRIIDKNSKSGKIP